MNEFLGNKHNIYQTNEHDIYEIPPTFSEYDPAILAQLADAPIYRKNGEVGAFQVAHPEEVETILADGTKETSNTAYPGDWVVENMGDGRVGGEKWVVKADDFASRYESTERPGVFQATGVVRAIQNPTSEPVLVEKSWESQYGDSDCVFAVDCDPETGAITGPFRIIDGEVFVETYARLENAHNE